MKNTFSTKRLGKGTNEWSDASYNICRGCEHGCLYCYAKAMRSRFDFPLRTPGNWERQQLRHGTKLGTDIKEEGVVMFPTTHDITPKFLPYAVTTIRNLLNAGNQVLIVSKPHLSVVRGLCREFAQNKKDILFRFSIGALDRNLCAFWEPGAPSPAARIRALQFAQSKGFATSVSVEPMLDSVDATVELARVLDPYVTDTIWIGKMQRVPIKLNAHVPGFAAAREKVRHYQTDSEILRLVDQLKGNSKIRWKDSIKAAIADSDSKN